MEEKIVIKLEELPPRAENLSLDELSGVFGGCNGTGGACSTLRCDDCCAGYHCEALPNGNGYCTAN